MRRTFLAWLWVALAMAGLQAFLAASYQAGRTHVAVSSPRNATLMRAERPDAADVQACIDADAEQMPSTETYTYTVTAGTKDGDAFSTHAERVKGKKAVPADDEDHRVDVASTNTAGAALGHVVRANIALSKELVAMAREMRTQGAEAMKDARRLHTRLINSQGEYDLVRIQIEADRAKSEAWAGRVDGFIGTIKALAEGAMAGRGLLGQGAEGDSLASLKASLENVQRARIREIVGAEAWEAILEASTVEALADALLTRVGQERMGAVFSVLNKDQQTKVALMCKPHWEKRQKEARERAEAEKRAKEGGGGDGQA